jgi:hypothetical protein
MPYRAILIPADSSPVWIDLADDGDALCAAVGGWCDFSVIARSGDRDGPGVNLAVYEYSLLDDSPHNTIASDIVAAVGRTFHVHGTAVLLGLDGPATVDLTEQQWADLTRHLVTDVVTRPAASAT